MHAPREEPLLAMGAPIAMLILAILFVFHGAIKLYFVQDDFRDLAVAVNLQPPPTTLWRSVSTTGFMAALFPLFGLRPALYHLTVLAAHCCNAVLLFLLLQKRLGSTAALLGVTWFAVHPSLFTALYWLSARADVIATTFMLLTISLVLDSSKRRWLGLLTFALALLSKESVVALPIGILIARHLKIRHDDTGPIRSDSTQRRDPLLWSLLSMSCVFSAYLAIDPRHGLPLTADPRAPYSIDARAIVNNLLTYVGWATDIVMLRPGMRFVDAPNPELYPLGIAVTVAGLWCGFVPALRQRGWWASCIVFSLLLLPVLPLRNHTYRYYLYAPLTAVAWGIAIVVAVIRDRGTRSGRRTTLTVRAVRPSSTTLRGAVVGSVALTLLLTVNSARLIFQMEHRPSSVYPGLRGDPIVDRALIAERAIKDIQAAYLPSPTSLSFVLRERLTLQARIARGSTEAPPPVETVYPETNVRSALLDGLGVRVAVPQVLAVRFATTLGPEAVHQRYAVYAPNGDLEVYAPAALDSLLASEWILRW